ncbi:MAG: aminoacetone oxidase family FAD-binding enzyme [Lachnospiraceae bacterium]|nr:aminoacetone oxidase family FAD-binding enzyme [Lachnospiraceae bacterium]
MSKDKKTLTVIGSGPAGMMAAITAAGNGMEVTVIEQNEKLCRKIYATGNGRCNFTNLNWKGDVIRSGDVKKALKIIKGFDNKALIEFFDKLGVPAKTIGDYVYPNSEQALSVAEALICEAKQLNIKLIANEKALDIKNKNNSFEVYTNIGRYISDKLLIAVGGKASPIHGSDGNLNKKIKELGLHISKQMPALVALKTDDKKLEKLAGVRVKCKVFLDIDGKAVNNESGEIIFNKGNISGIPVMILSRYAALAFDEKKKVKLVIDFFPELEEHVLTEKLQQLFYNTKVKNKTAYEVMIGYLNNKLLDFCLRESGINPDKPAYSNKHKNITELVSLLKNFELSVKATEGFEKAQVSLGGVPLSEVNDKLESMKIPGLYFAGEILDVDGSCGGYNLQWAFSSGFVAGSDAAK